MPTRSRSRARAACSAGKIELIYNGTVYSTTTGYAGATWHETCDDTTDSPPFIVPHPLVITSRKVNEPLRINGVEPYAPLPILNYYYTDYNPSNRSGYAYCPSVDPIVWAYWQTKALANLNPGVPKVDIPLFLFELKDMPEMLKNLGEVLGKHRSVKTIPNGYLAYSFGWAPLISDLQSLWNFSQEVEARCRYLRKLEHGTYIRRGLTPKGGQVVQRSITPNGYGIPASDGGYIYQADVQEIETQKVWFTANAKLLTPLPTASETLKHQVSKILLGLNPSTVSLWNALPWSWLLDYFANLGDFMNAQRGNFVLSIPSMCIMAREEITSELMRIRVRSGFSATGGTVMSTVTKQRYVVYQPVPWLALDPIISRAQIANLGALITSKALGSPSRLGR